MAAPTDPAGIAAAVAEMVRNSGARPTAENYNRAMLALLNGEELAVEAPSGRGTRGARSNTGGAAPDTTSRLERALSRTTGDSPPAVPAPTAAPAVAEPVVTAGPPTPEEVPAPGAPVVIPQIPAPPVAPAQPGAVTTAPDAPTTAMAESTKPQKPGEEPVQVGEGEEPAEAPMTRALDRMMGEHNAPAKAAPSTQTVPLNARPPVAIDNPPGGAEVEANGGQLEQRPRGTTPRGVNALRELGAMTPEAFAEAVRGDVDRMLVGGAGFRVTGSTAPISQLFSGNPLPFRNQFGTSHPTQAEAQAAWNAQMLARRMQARAARGAPTP